MGKILFAPNVVFLIGFFCKGLCYPSSGFSTLVKPTANFLFYVQAMCLVTRGSELAGSWSFFENSVGGLYLVRERLLQSCTNINLEDCSRRVHFLY